MRDIGFALIWALLIPASLFAPYVGALLWIWTALLSPNELFYGFMADVPLNKLAALTTMFMLLATREKRQPYFDTAQALLLLFALVATMSWLTALQSTDATTDLYFKVLKEVVLAFVICMVMVNRNRIQLVILVMAVSIGFTGVKEGLMFMLTAGGHKVIGTGAIGDNNSAATAMLMSIPLMFYLYRYTQPKYIRAGMIVALVLSVIGVIATFSRGGFIGLLVLGLMTVKNGRSKFASLALVAVAGLLIYMLAPDSYFARTNTIDTAGTDGSFMGRVLAWKISLLIALDHPLFGGGLHAVQQFTTWFTYVPKLGSLDFIATPPPDNFPHAAHSVWFEILGDLGFSGLIVFLGLLITTFWNLRVIVRRGRGNPALRWAQDLARMVQMSLVAYAVTASALSMGYFEMLYVLVALTSRLRWLVDQASRAATDDAAADIRVGGRLRVPAMARV